MDEAELIKRLLETFKLEATEHLNIIAKGLIDLEKGADKDKETSILEEIYRSAHSMKGASRAVNLTEIEKICQSLESCFSMLKKNELKTSPQIFDIFHSILNTIEMLLDEDEEKPDQNLINNYIELLANIKLYEEKPGVETQPGGTGKTEKPKPEQVQKGGQTENEINFFEKDINEKQQVDADIKPADNTAADYYPELDEDLQEEKIVIDTQKESKLKEPRPGAKGSDDTVRLSTKKINDIYLIAEESLQIKLSHNQETNQLKEIIEGYKSLKEKWASIYDETLRNKQLVEKEPDKRVSYLNTNSYSNYENLNEQFKSIDKNFNELSKTSGYVNNTIQNILDNLVAEVKQILMVPFSNLFNSYPRIVRDLAKDMNKDIYFEMSGTNIEVDRRIMEGLKDPLIHIIRNSIDHGIEKPEVRKKAGKDPKGKISIGISQKDANHVRINITDDGAGINTKKLIGKALKSKIITKEEASKLSDHEAMQLMFESGISTASIITDISGRGLGLAIVEEKVENLGGKITIESEAGKGTTFSMEVPTSVSKSQGLIVSAGNKKFIIPVSNTVETLRKNKDALRKVENRDTIQYENRTLPLVRLSDVLEISGRTEATGNYIYIIVIESLNQRIGFIVDEIDNEQEVLFKKLMHPLEKVKNIAGVSLLGTGELCPILNSQDLVKNALQATSIAGTGDKKQKSKDRQKSVLMAEDSITSRLFLKNILEGAGYKVKATVDGKEAFTSLKQEKFDILISDIEMPRMNGFELTEAVRNDKSLADLPIVLVTSLNKKEDQEKGIDVGANAYIIKSSFEQSNLLEVIKRLI